MSVGEYLTSQFSRLSLPGLSCSVSYRGEIADYHFGTSDLQTGTPVSDKSIFNIASVGKLITAVCILKLIEDNKFKLDTAIGELLSDLPSGWNAVEIGHLLTHSSGLKSYTDKAEYWSEYHMDVPKSRIIEYVQDADLQSEPGSQWSYSNTGFYLLGLIIEKVTAQDYFRYALDLVGSCKSGLTIIPTDDRLEIPGKVTGYTQKDGELIKPPYYSNSGTFAAGGFSANLHDFIDFENSLFSGKIISDTSLNKIIQPYRKKDGSILRSPDPVFDFAMTHGLFRFENSGRPFLAHRGEIFGFTTEYRRMIDDDFSMIISTNSDHEFNSSEIINEVYKLMQN